MVSYFSFHVERDLRNIPAFVVLIGFTENIDFATSEPCPAQKITEKMLTQTTRKKKGYIYCVIISKSYHYDILQQQQKRRTQHKNKKIKTRRKFVDKNLRRVVTYFC